MTWTTFYLVCFLLGFSLSAVSWLLGVLGMHLPHLHGDAGHLHAHHVHLHAGHGHPHVPHAGHAPHAPAAHGSQALLDAAPSAFNFATIAAFLAWFGGTGYLFSRYSVVWPLIAFFAAIGTGLVGAAMVFWFMAKVLWSPNENLDPDDYDVVGLLGVVSSSIREGGGTGEILYTQAGARRVAGARSEDGAAIAKGVEVVITKQENGLVYVRTWEEMNR